MNTITVREYDCLVSESEADIHEEDTHVVEVGNKTFSHLQQLHARNEKIQKVLTPVITSKGQHGLKINRYVGVLQTPDRHLEILPKIKAGGTGNESARNALIRMLCFLGPYRVLETSLPTAVRMVHMPLWEIFIALFLESVSQLLRRGLRFSYSRHRSNQTYCRGKLLAERQLRHNLFHPERFFIEYDRFSANRPANRLIRSALDAVRHLTAAPDNQRRLRELSFALADIPPSRDYCSDFQILNLDREMGYYPPVLDWCRIILEHNNPLTAIGEQAACSLLFPMPEVFESYVAGRLRRALSATPYRVKTQVADKYLAKPHFQLKPDILIEDSDNSPVWIMDTKWKLLDNNKATYGLDQKDLYQMFAYGHKYLNGTGNLALIYPQTPEFRAPIEPFCFTERGAHGELKLYLLPFHLQEETLVCPQASQHPINLLFSALQKAA